MQAQTETKPALPWSADAASPIRQLPLWKVIPLLILLQLPANIILLLSYHSFRPHRTLSFLISGPQRQKRQSRGRRGASALCATSQCDWGLLFNPAIRTGEAHWFPWWPPHQHRRHSRNRTMCCAMSRGFSEGQTHKQILELRTAGCSQRQQRWYRQLQKVYIIPPPILINYYSIPFLGSHPAAGRCLDAGDAAALSRAL